MTDQEDLGLRERKRRQTRRAITVAAITIAHDRGLDGATVDEIARVADVSPRTFFNYFSSKEEAILGDQPRLPEDDTEAMAAFVAGTGPLMPALAAVVTTAVAPVVNDHELVVLRRDLMKAYPELNGRRMAGLHVFENDVVRLVERRLALEHPDLAADAEALTSRARLVGLVAISVMRHAWFAWLETGGDRSSVLDHLDESVAELEELFGRPVVTV